MESIYSLSESVVRNIGSPPNQLALSSLINFRLPCLYINCYHLSLPMRDPGFIPAPLNEDTCITSVPNEWSNITPLLSNHCICEQQSKVITSNLLSLHLYNDDNIFRAQEECSEQLVHIQPPTTLPLHPIYGAPPGQGGQWAPCAEIPTGKM